MKRIFDIICSIIFLLIFLPFGILIAIILKFTGEKEIFYFQERVGLEGKIISIYKFVTMVSDSPNIGAGDITLKNDPRVLPTGKFLRKTKINEFPQFINVLIGDMSIVGPRPLVKNQFDMIPSNLKVSIKKIKPGITSLGSIIFRDEEKYLNENKEDSQNFYKEKIVPYKSEIENWYFYNQSLSIDIKIVFITALTILNPNKNYLNIFFKDLPRHKVFHP